MTKSPSTATEVGNRVHLIGRVIKAPETRMLPSGLEVVTFRISVPRDRSVMTKGSRQSVDWMDCTAWTARMRARVCGWRAEDWVEVEGALRRRHLPQGAGSIVDVEVRHGVLSRRAISRGSRMPAVSASESGGAEPD